MPKTLNFVESFDAPVAKVYEVLVSAKAHAAGTGAAATVDGKDDGIASVGSKATHWKGFLEGEFTELVPSERVVEKWRSAQWDEGVYSVCTFTLATGASPGTTSLTIEHKDVPDDWEHGWGEHYFEPMRRYFATGASLDDVAVQSAAGGGALGDDALPGDMVHLYHYPGTRGTRVLWLLHELNLPHEVHVVDFGAMKKPPYLAVNPNGTVPAATHRGATLIEAGAILEHLLRRGPTPRRGTITTAHGSHVLTPASWDDAAWARHWNYVYWTITTLDGRLINSMFGLGKLKKTGAWWRTVVQPAMLRDLALNAGGHLNGADFTATDIYMGYSLYFAHKKGYVRPEGESAPIHAYWQKISERPAFKAAFADMGYV